MRIDQLRIGRYAHHQDRVLDFQSPASGAPDLHVIAGHNATGKSSTRAAIVDLLYGIQNVSPWAIGYEQRLLRIGAVISDKTGRKLDFIRVKGRKNPLLDAQENPLDESILKGFLGVQERDLYKALYALDQAAFREGGEEMLRADSDVGQTIFAAASGLATLSEVRAALQAEADAIGSAARRSEQKPVWQAERAYIAALQQAQDSSIRIEDWNAADRAHREASEAVDALLAEQTALETERDTFERHLRVLPVLLDLGRLRGELQALGAPRPLPEDFGDRWRAARQASDAAALELERAKGGKTRAEATRSDLPETAGALPAFAAEIEFQNTQIAKIRNLIDDQGKLERDSDRLHERLQDLAKGLGSSSEAVEALIEKIPGAQAIARVRALITTYEVETTSKEHAGKTKLAAERSLKEAEDALEKLGKPEDPAEAAALVHAIRSLEADAKKEVRDKKVLTDARATEGAKLRALSGWSGTAEDLLHSIFPSSATLEAAKAEIDKARQEQALAEAKLETAETELLEIEASAAGAGIAIPTEDDVSHARTLRDRRWSELRETARRQAVPAEDALDTYETEVRQADRTVDQRLDGADEIAGQRLQLAERQRKESARYRAEKALEKKSEALKAARAAAAALWAGSAYQGEVGTPDQMLTWLQHRENALDAINARIEAEGEAEDSEIAVKAGVATLRQAADLLKVTLPATLENPAAIEAAMALIRGALEAGQTKTTQAEQFEAEISRRQTELETAAEDSAKTEQAVADWTRDWAEALPAVNLPAEAEPEAVEAVLEQWSAFAREAQTFRDTERRLDGIRDNLAAHHAEIEALVHRIWPEGTASLASAPDEGHWHDWPSLLYAVLGAAKKTAEAIERADRAVEEAAAEHGKAETADTAATNAVKKLRTEAGLSEEDDVSAAIDASTRLRALTAAIEEKTRALSEAGDGETEEPLKAAIGTQTRVEIQDVSAKNADRRGELQAEMSHAVERRLECRNALNALEKRTGSSAAQHAAFGHAGEVGDLTRRWMRLMAAQHLLETAIERYRQEHEGELIRRANEIFIGIAGNRAPDHFIRLEVTYDQPEDPQLVAVRKDGADAGISELSEGTRDQLWLSLRIAALEQRAKTGEPMPFLADDLFASFDTARTEMGLRFLAELAKFTQVILFTHHDYVVSAAKGTAAMVHML